MYTPNGYLRPFACFRCRRSFRRPYEPGVKERPCSMCGGVAIQLDRKFKAPRKADRQQWAKVEYLVRHGFRFQSVYGPAGEAVAYPTRLHEAEAFVARYGQPAGQQRDA